jgi:hypothetical protein
LSKQSRRWEAGEGNGGLATYELIGKYADTLEKAPTYVVTPADTKRDVECEWLGTGKKAKLRPSQPK